MKRISSTLGEIKKVACKKDDFQKQTQYYEIKSITRLPSSKCVSGFLVNSDPVLPCVIMLGSADKLDKFKDAICNFLNSLSNSTQPESKAVHFYQTLHLKLVYY